MDAKAHNARRRGGFTLVEIAVATAVIGIGITALVASLQAGTSANSGSEKINTAAFMAQQIHEWTLRLPFKDTDAADANNPPGPDGNNDPHVFVDDVDDLMNVTFSTAPAERCPEPSISIQPGWSETITMTWRDPKGLQTIVANGTSDVNNVQVEVKFAGKHVLTTQYLVAKKN